MKATMMIEENPTREVINQTKTEVYFGDMEEINEYNLIKLFFNFCTQIGFDIYDVSSLIYEITMNNDFVEEEDTKEIGETIREKIESKKEDIEKIINQEDNRKKFLEQLSNNEQMLKEAFRLYLRDTMEISNSE